MWKFCRFFRHTVYQSTGQIKIMEVWKIHPTIDEMNLVETMVVLANKHYVALLLYDLCFMTLNSFWHHDYQRNSYLTVPEVFLSTEAAKFCVTPTKLVPSTSTIRSFTWILEEAVKREKRRSGLTVIAQLWPPFIISYTEAHTSHDPFISSRSWQRDLTAAARNHRDKWDNEACTPGNKNYNC